MKAYTDLEQPKKLADILPFDTADMWWSKNFIYYNPTAAIGISAEYSNAYTYKWGNDDIPCWSLAALLDIYPMVVGKDLDMYCCWQNRINLCSKHYDNPIDACV